MKPDILKSLDKEEVVFIAMDPMYLPHREEFNLQTQNARHWVVIIGYNHSTSTYTLLDEKFTYYTTYEYEEEVIAEAFSHGSRGIIHFRRTDPAYENLKARYLHFYKQFAPSQDVLFDIDKLMDKLEQDAGTMARRYFLAYSFFAGSTEITKQFFQYIGLKGDVIENLDIISKTADNVSSAIKKFELTGKLNLDYIEKRLCVLRQSFYHIIDYIHSETFRRYLDNLSLVNIVCLNNELTDSIQVIDTPLLGAEVNQHQIEISSHFNNQALGEIDSTADLTGGKEFFLLEKDLPSVITHENIAFKIHEQPGNGDDNVACKSQVIEIDSRVYNGIWLLACGEWGDPKGVLSVRFEDGDVEQITTQITDWAWPPKFGESIAISLPISRREKLAFVPEWGNIFAVRFPILRGKQACKLQLPDCPNLHIFSIIMTSL
ncbi:hypothetical protein [Paenibacillus kobensis]|uniref:hypothetical protein n=1 Tax=Paenibacillus kobensis TaxID=59841 RepID=UPI000FDB5691|nr:hypothetical protein [Paenibacillus kobensis]